MKNILRLPLQYMRYYKKQTLTLFTGILLSAALFTGLGSLLESGQHAAAENARTNYGDWHYSIRADTGWGRQYDRKPEGKGYHLEDIGELVIRKVIDEPYGMEFVYADQTYLDMMGRDILEGTYPLEKTQIAMDRHTLQNLNLPAKIGSKVTLDGETFTLSAILDAAPEKLSEQTDDDMQIFVSAALDYGKNGRFFYLKFDEHKDVYGQMESFCRCYGIDMEKTSVYRNNGLSGYVNAEPAEQLFSVIKTGLQNKGLGIPYIWGHLNSNGTLTEKAILLALGLFAIMILYSLFQVTVIKRMSQYSILQTLGMTDASTFLILFTELFLTFLSGYPLGCLLGNGIGMFLYEKTGKIFITRDPTIHTGANDPNQAYAVTNLPDAGRFCVSWRVILTGAVLFLLFLLLVSFLLMRQMQKLTIRQMQREDLKERSRRRKIYSLKSKNMADVLTNKFMFSEKKTFLLMLLSLSVGSIIFLGSAYVTENTRVHNELTFKADDGLGSDIEIYEESDQLTDRLPEETVKKMAEIPGIEKLHPVRYALGEIPLLNGSFSWPEFYGETANDPSNPPDPEIMDKYNGIILQTGKEDYLLKVNIYGYDDEMLHSLTDYLLDGSIDPEQMKQENMVIFKTLMDGQGYYDSIDLKPGDSLEIKTLKNGIFSQEALRFTGEESLYQKHTAEIVALVSRPLAKVDTYIGDNGTDAVDIIMSNEQMEKMFGITDYQTVSISLEKDADADKVVSDLGQLTNKIPRSVIKDYRMQIAAQNLYLTQKMLFFYGIALILLGISIIHLINSMQHLVATRRHEFGIIRAMGITDAGLAKMLAKEGLRYGLYSNIVVIFLYLIVQRILYYFMVHVYLYLQPSVFVSPLPLISILILNMAICVIVMLLSGKSILKEEIIHQIH